MAATTIGILDGTEGDDVINTDFIDPDGETAYGVLDLNNYDSLTVNAGLGDDLIDFGYEFGYPAMLYGGAGNDTIYVGGATAYGGDGNDLLRVDEDYGVLYGDAGDDTLSVNNANFTGTVAMTGGTGADTFDLGVLSYSTVREGTVNGVVKDFTIGEDRISIHGHTLTQSDFANGFASVASGDETITVTQVGSAMEVYWTDPHANDGSYWGDARLTVENTNLEEYIASLTPAVADGIVDGTDRAEMIDLGFVDADGESVTNDASIADMVIGGGGDDVIKVYAGDDTVMAGDGDDVIHGDKGANSLHGGAGNDLINSGRNTSELFGDDGDDTLNALLNKGADHTLTGGAGGDAFNMLAASLTKMSNVEITDFTVGEDTLLIDGTLIDPLDLPAGVMLDEDADGNSVLHFADNDTVTLTGVSNANLMGLEDPNGWVDGGKYDDVIDLDYVDESGEMVHDDASIVDEVHGKNGEDWIKLYAGDDIAYGGAKNDTIYGDKGHNEIYGENGNDLLHSGRNTSDLHGGNGDDILVSLLTKGADHTLEGGDGADWFDMVGASATKTSALVISDYQVGIDTISIDGAGFYGADLPEGVTVTEDEDGNAVINFSDDETVTLTGVSAADYTAEEPPLLEGLLLPPEAGIEMAPPPEDMMDTDEELLLV